MLFFLHGMTATNTTFSSSYATNKQLYTQLKQALRLGLGQQVFVAVCDHLSLLHQMASSLETELGSEDLLSTDGADTIDRVGAGDRSGEEEITTRKQVSSKLVTLHLELTDPNPIAQMCRWKSENPGSPLAFQILGVEKLTRQPAGIQWSFLNYLREAESKLIEFELSVLLWVSSPWLCCIQQSAPEFWRLHRGIFKFVGDPSPVYDQALSGQHSPGIHKSESERERVSSSVEQPKGQRVAQTEPIDGSPSGLVYSQEYLQSCLKRAYIYRDRISKGNGTVPLLNEAIEAYNEVVEQLDEWEMLLESNSALPKGLDAVNIYNDLGTFHWMLFQQTRKSLHQGGQALANLEMSIICYQTGLMKVKPNSDGYIYVRVLKNLGAAYTDLGTIRDPVENLQQSITVYEEAINYLKLVKDQGRLCDSQGLDYRAIQNNLGTAYWTRAQHIEPVVNLKAAIAAYGEALRGYSENKEPQHYAMIQANLGTAYWNLAQHQPSKRWLQKAIYSYRKALKYRTSKADPVACATTENNLGTACWHLAMYQEEPEERSKSLNEAIAAYEKTLTLAQQLSPTQLTFDTLATHNNLGLAYYRLATDQALCPRCEQRVSHLEKALHHHLMAGSYEAIPEEGSATALESERHRLAFNHLVRTLRALYQESGPLGQNQALSKIPGHLLPEIWRYLS
ncbi:MULTISPECIES: tetratricopeptide repeat protein [Limnospira]|jgi:tetratricopeptide (TPR) repeat protein|uniref:Tetratricopeptide repeat protein n=1 Tax=Limnospira platensis NIES-46 TaxID=1236695 RepID=A0A5M3TBY4_LIMPL|nr:tetratricopeptide repeat protein [Arthrospira platensis]MDF2208853.1 tetratricopeptide repeat protein [Arthrospira platensis NCB002]BAI94375.1 hypothetical protein NIES39_R00660 [Arthrospira platensis NIES-39]BDT16562.1 hypothetical protein N39L_62850 [Arthrospira platensis NIES-39]GCE95398.1 hypothetical protein NIES46_34610 [Arthrospira platensis NIES-46]